MRHYVKMKAVLVGNQKLLFLLRVNLHLMTEQVAEQSFMSFAPEFEPSTN